MENGKASKKALAAAAFIGVMHPIESVIAARMARKRGRKPLPWAAATLVFGVFAMRRLRKLGPAPAGAKQG